MTDPSAQRLKDLVDTLYEKTTEGSLPWKVGFDDNVVEANFTHNVVRVARVVAYDEHSGEGEQVYYVELADKLGTVIDTIWPYDVSPLGSPPGANESYWKAFEALYRIAARQASGVDKVVQDILLELKRK